MQATTSAGVTASIEDVDGMAEQSLAVPKGFTATVAPLRLICGGGMSETFDVRARLADQARTHWLEFAVIVASANVVAALALAGRVLARSELDRLAVSTGGVAIASLLAVMLAYYSIQVGALLEFGSLRLEQVFLSFLIAGAQLSLFLWPLHVLGTKPLAAPGLEELRHWLLFYALFAFAAAATNWRAARVRSGRQLGPAFDAYERGQRQDGWAAIAAGTIALASWVLSLIALLPGIAVGVIWATLASIMGLASQTRAASRTAVALGLSDAMKERSLRSS